MKKLLIAMAIGAALAWFLDPDTGSRRRDTLRRKLDEKGITGGSSAKSPTVAADYPTPLVATGP